MQHILFIAGLVLLKIVQESESKLKKTNGYDADLSNFLKDIVENLRNDVPPLDPLVLPQMDAITISDNDDMFDALHLKLKLKQWSITGITKYHVEDLMVSTKTNMVNFSLSLPEMTTRGQYHLYGKVMELFKLENEGPFTMIVKKVHIEGYSTINITANGKVCLKDLNLNLTYGTSEVEFPNLVGKGRYSKLLYQVSNILGKILFNLFHQEAMAELSSSMLALINKELDQTTMTQLLFSLM